MTDLPAALQTPDAMARLCANIGYDTEQIVEGLRDAFGLTDTDARDIVSVAQETHMSSDIDDTAL